MKHIEKLDAARGQKINFEELGVRGPFFWAYIYSREAETDTLDFEDLIWEQDIPSIIEDCQSFEIDRFTISCGMSSMAETIWELEKQGCRLIGMTEVNTRFTDWETNQRLRIPAFESRIRPA